MPDHSLKFECNDCDHLVFSAGPVHNPNRRCAGCQFISEMPDPAEREQLRAWMAEHDVIGTPRPRAAVESYTDPSCPPRACDHCGRSYRGPGVYCCLSCTLADA